jgi:hypothetical protein
MSSQAEFKSDARRFHLRRVFFRSSMQGLFIAQAAGLRVEGRGESNPRD